MLLIRFRINNVLQRLVQVFIKSVTLFRHNLYNRICRIGQVLEIKATTGQLLSVEAEQQTSNSAEDNILSCNGNVQNFSLIQYDGLVAQKPHLNNDDGRERLNYLSITR